MPHIFLQGLRNSSWSSLSFTSSWASRPRGVRAKLAKELKAVFACKTPSSAVPRVRGFGKKCWSVELAYTTRLRALSGLATLQACSADLRGSFVSLPSRFQALAGAGRMLRPRRPLKPCQVDSGWATKKLGNTGCPLPLTIMRYPSAWDSPG